MAELICVMESTGSLGSDLLWLVRSSPKDASPAHGAFSPLMSMPMRGLTMVGETRPMTPNASNYAGSTSEMAVIPTATVVAPQQRTSTDAEALWCAFVHDTACR